MECLWYYEKAQFPVAWRKKGYKLKLKATVGPGILPILPSGRCGFE